MTQTGGGAVETPWLMQVVEHIRNEYDQMPGLCLTLSQAQRLWALDPCSCRLALTSMVEMGLLTASPFGYVRDETRVPTG